MPRTAGDGRKVLRQRSTEDFSFSDEQWAEIARVAGTSLSSNCRRKVTEVTSAYVRAAVSHKSAASAKEIDHEIRKWMAATRQLQNHIGARYKTLHQPSRAKALRRFSTAEQHRKLLGRHSLLFLRAFASSALDASEVVRTELSDDDRQPEIYADLWPVWVTLLGEYLASEGVSMSLSEGKKTLHTSFASTVMLIQKYAPAESRRFSSRSTCIKRIQEARKSVGLLSEVTRKCILVGAANHIGPIYRGKLSTRSREEINQFEKAFRKWFLTRADRMSVTSAKN